MGRILAWLVVVGLLLALTPAVRAGHGGGELLGHGGGELLRGNR